MPCSINYSSLVSSTAVFRSTLICLMLSSIARVFYSNFCQVRVYLTRENHLLQKANDTMSHSSFISSLFYCLIHIALSSMHHPIHAVFSSTLPLNAIIHAALPYMLLSHATVLWLYYHHISMLYCHITVSSPHNHLVPMLPFLLHTTISYQCNHFFTKVLSHPHTTMLPPHCFLHINTIQQQKHSNRPPALT